MTITIGGVAVPASMQDAGDYVWTPEEVIDEDGNGDPILAPFSSAVWTFDYMTVAEFDWWAQTICLNQRTRLLVVNSSMPIELPDTTRMQTFQRVRVWRPQVEGFDRGIIQRAVVRFDRMVRDLV